MDRAIDLASTFKESAGATPFGAVVVVGGSIVGEGVSLVVAHRDPTAHAEVLALREACARLGTHLLPEAEVYSSGYPCPLCLMACYWSQVNRVYYGAELQDSAAVGFEDDEFYHQLKLNPNERSVAVLPAGQHFRSRAVVALRAWQTRHH